MATLVAIGYPPEDTAEKARHEEALTPQEPAQATAQP